MQFNSFKECVEAIKNLKNVKKVKVKNGFKVELMLSPYEKKIEDLFSDKSNSFKEAIGMILKIENSKEEKDSLKYILQRENIKEDVDVFLKKIKKEFKGLDPELEDREIVVENRIAVNIAKKKGEK